MSKMSDLMIAIDELRRCGEVLISVSDSIRELHKSDENHEESNSVMATAAGTVKEEQLEEPKTISFEEVRAALANKARAGFTAEVKTLIEKHGAAKLSDIDPSEYEAVLTEAEVIGNA